MKNKFIIKTLITTVILSTFTGVVFAQEIIGNTYDFNYVPTDTVTGNTYDYNYGTGNYTTGNTYDYNYTSPTVTGNTYDYNYTSPTITGNTYDYNYGTGNYTTGNTYDYNYTSPTVTGNTYDYNYTYPTVTGNTYDYNYTTPTTYGYGYPTGISTFYGSVGYGYTGFGYTGGSYYYPSISWTGYTYPSVTPTTQCPSGQTLINNVCVPSTQCPAGQTLVNNICQPNTQCPTGTTFINGVCQVNTTQCPAGTTLINGTCQINNTQCPNGTTLINGTCQINNTQCPNGTTLVNGVCQVNNTQCPSGSTLVNGVCQLNNTQCPSGTTLTNGVCVINTTQCPAGSTLVNGVCQAPINCPAGTTLTNGVCVGNGVTQCPAGSTLTNGVCVINTTQCPAGSSLVNGVCQAPISCPAGTYFSNGTCVSNVVTSGYTCSNGTVVAYSYLCPITYSTPYYNYNYNYPVTYQTCWDGTTIPSSSVCPSQYKVCANGTSVPVNQTCYYGNSYVPYTPAPTITFNNAITSVATEVTTTSGRCNGIGLIAKGAPSTGWFEYGETSNLGRSTASASIGSSATAPFSNVLANLKTGTTYYCRAVMQNQYGTFKGEIVRFTTKTKSTTYVKPVTKKSVVKTTKKNEIVCSDGSTVTVGSKSAADLLQEGQKLIALQVQKTNGNLSAESGVTYSLSYKNLSDSRLTGVVVKVLIPQEIEFTSASAGNYDSSTHTLTLNQDTIDPYSEGMITWTGKMSKDSQIGKSIVTTAYVVYTVPGTRVQDEITAYVVGSIVPAVASNNTGAKNVIGAGSGSFLPDTLVEWLALIAIIFIIFILGRSVYASYKNDRRLG